MFEISIIKGFKKFKKGFPGGAVVKNQPANAGDTGSSPVRHQGSPRLKAFPLRSETRQSCPLHHFC